MQSRSEVSSRRPAGPSRRGFLLASLSGLTLAACGAVGPDFFSPVLETPIEWRGPLPSMSDNPVDLATWWQGFDDERMTSLITRAITNNLDLQIAQSRVREARALYRQAAAGRLPSASIGSDYTYRATDVTPDPLHLQTGDTQLFDASFDASWELDIFGGTRRAIEAAEAGAQAEVEARRDVLVSLTAEVATNYIELRGAQRRLALARESLSTQRQTQDLVNEQVSAGVATDLDLARARALVASTSAQIPGLEAQIQASINRLSVLLGLPPGALQEELERPRAIPVAIIRSRVGVPADLLRRRPDLRRAERLLAQSTANIGVAVAELYPKFSIPARLSFAAAGIGTSQVVETLVSTLSAALQMTVFDGGARSAAVDAAEERQTQALLTYRQTLLLALEEAENALVNYREAVRRRQSLASAVSAYREAYNLANELYREGAAGFLDVLDAQRELTSALQNLAVAETDVSSRLVAVYKALGGGWSEADEIRD